MSLKILVFESCQGKTFFYNLEKQMQWWHNHTVWEQTVWPGLLRLYVEVKLKVAACGEHNFGIFGCYWTLCSMVISLLLWIQSIQKHLWGLSELTEWCFILQQNNHPHHTWSNWPCVSCKGFIKFVWSNKGFRIFKSMPSCIPCILCQCMLLCVPPGWFYSTEHKEAAVFRTTQLNLLEFLAKTDGGRTETLIEKSLPTCLSHSSQRRLRVGGRGEQEATALAAMTIWLGVRYRLEIPWF